MAQYCCTFVEKPTSNLITASEGYLERSRDREKNDIIKEFVNLNTDGTYIIDERVHICSNVGNILPYTPSKRWNI